MDTELSCNEARVLGCLIEKAATTPDYYPLSLSALQSACNQKSNREPVLNLSESEVMEALDGLISHHLVAEKTPFGARVTKYAHRLSNTLGLTYSFTKNELGILCVLMLRGPQTVGELRGRSARLCEFASLDEVAQVLQDLSNREDGPWVVQLERLPGRKEPRFMHLWCGAVDDASFAAPAAVIEKPGAPHHMEERVSRLEQSLAELQSLVDDLKRRFSA